MREFLLIFEYGDYVQHTRFIISCISLLLLAYTTATFWPTLFVSYMMNICGREEPSSLKQYEYQAID
jgi:hypothetical protein